MGNGRRVLRWRWLMLLLLAALSITAAVMWRIAGQSDPVALDEVLTRFRAQGEAAGTTAPAPGVYRYSLTGRERGGAGPLQVERTLPAVATALVTRTSGGWQSEVLYSRQHIEGARYVVRDDAIDMVWRRVDVTFGGLGRDDRRDLTGRYRIAPRSPAVGDRFDDTYRAGTLTNRVRTRVVRSEDVSVGGLVVPTMVIESDTVTTGAFSGTRREVLWWSPELRVPIRTKLDVVVAGVVGYESHLEMQLIEVEPAT